MSGTPSPLLLAGTLFLAAWLEFLLAVGLIVWVRRRTGAEWRVVIAGALVFILFQILTRVPLVTIAQGILAPRLAAAGWFWWGWILALSFSAGLFEEVGRWMGYRYFVPRAPRTWATGVAFGAGHAAAEAALLVAPLTFSSALNVVLLSYVNLAAWPFLQPQAEQIEAARAMLAQVEWWVPFLGVVERMLTFPVHIALALLVLKGVREGKPAVWIGVAIGFHTAVNLAGVATQRFYGPLAAEGVIALFSVLALGWILTSRRHF